MRPATTLLSLLLLAGAAIAEEAVLWIGTTTPRNGESKGIYRATLNTDTGALSKPQLAAEIASLVDASFEVQVIFVIREEYLAELLVLTQQLRACKQL